MCKENVNLCLYLNKQHTMEMSMWVVGYIQAFWVPTLDHELPASRPFTTHEEDRDTH